MDPLSPMEFEEAMAARVAAQQRRDAPAKINGCVISLADGGQVATAEYSADDLASGIKAAAPHQLCYVRTGPDPSQFVWLNPFYIVAIQPAAVHPPSEEAPA